MIPAPIWWTDLHCVFCPRPADGPPLDSNRMPVCRAPRGRPGQRASRGRQEGETAACQEGCGEDSAPAAGRDDILGERGKGFLGCSFPFEGEGVLRGDGGTLLAARKHISRTWVLPKAPLFAVFSPTPKLLALSSLGKALKRGAPSACFPWGLPASWARPSTYFTGTADSTSTECNV